MSGRLRPKRSDSVPWVICPIARPANQAASVSCAEPGGAPNEASIAGKAGRYMSVVDGPTAVRKPSRMGSQAGKRMRQVIAGCHQRRTSSLTTHELTAAFGPQHVPVSRLGFGGAPAGLSNYLGAYDAAAAANRATMDGGAAPRGRVGGELLRHRARLWRRAGRGDFRRGTRTERKVFLATKVSLTPRQGSLRQSLEASLRRLRRDRIDLLQLHGSSYGPDETHAVLRKGGMLDELARLKQEGLIGLTGFTSEETTRPSSASSKPAGSM